MNPDDLEWLLAEHEGLEEELPALLEALGRDPPGWGEVRSRLDSIALELPIHLEVEELVVFPWLGQRLPAAIGSLDGLLREHHRLVEELNEIRSLAAAEHPAADLRERVQHLIRNLRGHSRMEKDLLERALEAPLPAASDSFPTRGPGGRSRPQ